MRAALVAGATRMVDERGVDRFSLREVATALHVSPSAAYRHFEDRAALLDAVLDEEFGRLIERFGGAKKRAEGRAETLAGKAVGAFAAFGGVHVALAAERPAMFHAMFGSRSRSIGPNERAVETTVMSALMDLVSSEAVAPDRFQRLTMGAWPAYHGLASLVADGRVARADVKESLAELTAMVMIGAGVDQSVLADAGLLRG